MAALPMLVLVGMFLGPVALVLLWVLACVSPFLLAGAAVVHHQEARLRHRRT